MLVQINTISYPQIIDIFSNFNICPWNKSILTCENNFKACLWKKKVCVKVRNIEKSGRETTFLPVKQLPKGAKIWFHKHFWSSREKKHWDWVNLCGSKPWRCPSKSEHRWYHAIIVNHSRAEHWSGEKYVLYFTSELPLTTSANTLREIQKFTRGSLCLSNTLNDREKF